MCFWLQEGGKLPQPAGLLSAGTATCFPEPFLPCPRRDPRAGLGQRGSHGPGCAPPQGSPGGSGGRAWLQSWGTMANGHSLTRDQRQNQAMFAACERPRLALGSAAPQGAEKLGLALWSFCSSEEHVGLAEVLHSVLAVITQKRPSPV